jgi:class 3 adenylate cyclase
MLGKMATLPGADRFDLRTARQLEESGDAAEIYDSGWHLRWVSPELRQVLGNPTDDQLGIGRHVLELFAREPWRSRVSKRSRQRALRKSLPYHLWGSDPQEIAALKGKALRQAIGKTEAHEPPDLWSVELEVLLNDLAPLEINCLNITFSEPGFKGYVRLYSSGMRASVLSLVARGSIEMFERMSRLVEPGRHPVAILFCDIEGSTDLARQLPSSVYFELLAALAKAIDDVVIRHDGVVGKHAGDGASAYFLADDHGQASAAARAAIVSGWEIRARAEDIAGDLARDYGIGDLDLGINVGLHWGSTVYVGQIVSGGRLEVTALGEEVNECARLEQAAREGRTLASKELLERLDDVDAEALGIELRSMVYRQLRHLDSLPRKVLRDVGNLPVAALPRTRYET